MPRKKKETTAGTKPAPKKRTRKKKALNVPPSTTNRRQIRFRLFRIREGNDVVKDDLKAHIEAQFQIGMTWDNFTFLWDVSPADPLKVIREDEWKDLGGRYDPITGRKYPSAFTHQEK